MPTTRQSSARSTARRQSPMWVRAPSRMPRSRRWHHPRTFRNGRRGSCERPRDAEVVRAMSRVMTKAEHAWLLDMAPQFRSWDDLLASFECAWLLRQRQTAQCYTSKHGVLRATPPSAVENGARVPAGIRPRSRPGRDHRRVQERFDIRLRVTQLKDRESTLSLKQGTFGGRFAPGTIPPNKGKKLTDYVKDEAKLANIRRSCLYINRRQHSLSRCRVAAHRRLHGETERGDRDRRAEAAQVPVLRKDLQAAGQGAANLPRVP